jgi:NosR/NirI family nitrous oxide reductase transcriptional regulator
MRSGPGNGEVERAFGDERAGCRVTHRGRAAVVAALCALLFLALWCPPAAAQARSRLSEFLTTLKPAAVFPGADRFGPVEGAPPSAPVFAGDRLLGHVYLNSDVVNTTGYSGKPIHIVIGLSLDAKIAGAALVEHHEPIVLIGIPLQKIVDFIAGYVGRSVFEAQGASPRGPDIVSGATVTVMVIGDTIMRSGVRVARAKGLGQGGAAVAAAAPAAIRTIDESQGAVEGWETLLGDGSVRRLHLTVGEVNEAFAKSGNQEAAARPESGEPGDAFIDLYVGLASVPAIGRSLLGEAEYERLRQQLKPGQHAIVVAGNGAYSFKGSGYVRGGIFDRFELVQEDASVRFRDRNHRRLGDLAAEGAPEFREIGLFIVPEGSGFAPTEPWRLQLLVQRALGGRDKAFITFDLGYTLPEKYVRTERPPAIVAAAPDPLPAARAAAPHPAAVVSPEPGEEALWERIWRGKVFPVALLVASLGILTAIFFFQDWLVRRPVLYDRVRLAFLAFTLVWIGWIAQAQLSVVNILTFASALRADFRWEYFLMAPLIFVLWFAVAAALLFWGRGAFCGWLCPFGALQELLNRGARLVGIPQLRVPWGVHQRLVAVKYVIFLVIFGLSLSALAAAEKAAEVEPFKTAIVLHFVRSWPFVLYAAALLAASLFIERFFCRYLCPLGAGLAIPARLRMFDWLRRYRECGNPCQRCANECPVQAIHPEGHINPNECIQCLHCQVLYHHDQKCPVMIQKRLRREKRLATTSPSMRPAPAGRAGVAADAEEAVPS